MKNLFVALLLAVFLFSVNSIAQEGRAGKIGLSYTGNFNSSSNEWGVSIWLADHFTLEPNFGFRHIDLESNSGTNLKPGLGLLFRVNDFVLSPYLGGRIKANLLSGGGNSYTDFIISILFGGEYFVSEWFSVGAEMRLNYIVTDDTFSPSYGIADASIFETEQVINIRIYFN